jgi:LacI family transcriptional regulator
MAASSSHVTMMQVADAAGVSVATVSYSLRGHPRIPRATATRIQALARKLGYRPNPRVASLMAHIRRGKPVTMGERLAFVWIDAEEKERPYRKTFDAVCARATQLGYAIEEFWRRTPGMSDARLQQIILARGITGVLISPSIMANPRIRLDWDWCSFAPVIVGTAESIPELHHASQNHYAAMRLVMLKLAARGKRRMAVLLSRGVDERARRAWSAAFLAYHPQPDKARELLFQDDADSAGQARSWLRQARPDAIIDGCGPIEALLNDGWKRPKNVQVVLLRWVKNKWNFGGIDQCEEVVAANAVDLLVSQLRNNERGVPESVKMLSVPGKWIEGKA